MNYELNKRIAVIMSEIVDPSDYELVKGAHIQAKKPGLDIIIITGIFNSQKELQQDDYIHAPEDGGIRVPEDIAVTGYDGGWCRIASVGDADGGSFLCGICFCRKRGRIQLSVPTSPDDIKLYFLRIMWYTFSCADIYRQEERSCRKFWSSMTIYI